MYTHLQKNICVYISIHVIIGMVLNIHLHIQYTSKFNNLVQIE